MSQPSNPPGGGPKTVNRTLLVIFVIVGIIQIILLIFGFTFPFQVISIVLNLIGLFYTFTQAAAPNFSSIGSIFRKVPRSVNIAIPIVLCLLLLLSLAVNYLFTSGKIIIAKKPQPTATATHVAGSSPTPTVTVPPSPTLTPIASSTPTPDRAGTPFLVDPMTGPNNQEQWNVVDVSYISCGFTNGGYDVKVPADSTGACNTNAPATIFTNFVYEIDMTIVSGVTNVTSSTRGAGLMFRYNNDPNGTTNSNYGIGFLQDGTYYLYADNHGPLVSLGMGTCTSFHQGARQTNLIDVEMQGSTMTLFVNNVYLMTATDTRFKSGQLGVQIASGNDSSEVVYSNLKVWML